MGPKTQALIETLTELAALLREHGETHWASWVESDAGSIVAGDFFGVTHHLSAYGGMGSLNDLVLSPMNGHRLEDTQAGRVNDSLSILRSRARSLADAISREAAVG